jgi:hypothetical protein
MHNAKHRVLRALTMSLLALGFARTAGARALSDLPSALVITKSSNRNQVNYSIEVDDACRPSGTAPVHPYWRMLEHGPLATEPLTESEKRVLGVQRQDVSGHRVKLELRGLPGRTITVDTERGPHGECSSSAEMTIAGVAAKVAGVFVQQRLFGIEYVLVTGRLEDGTLVRERIAP